MDSGTLAPAICERVGLVFATIAAHLSDPVANSLAEVVFSLLGLYLGWIIINIPHPSTLKTMTLKIRMTDETGEFTMLAQATGLRHLSLHDERNPASTFGSLHFVSALQPLNPASFVTLVSFSYGIDIGLFKLTASTARIDDPYNGLFSDGPFSQLANLKTLEVEIHFSGSAHSTIERKTFGPKWSALQNAIVPPGKPENERPHQKLSEIRFFVAMKGYFDVDEGMRLKKVVVGYLIGLHFGALKAAGWKGEASFESIGRSSSFSSELVLKYACAGSGAKD